MNSTHARVTLVGLLVGLLSIAAFAAFTPAVSATNYPVSANPYTANHTLAAGPTWNTYELTAANGQSVAYSMTITGGGCASLYFVRGHNFDPATSQYFVSYSQENCVTSYSNTFPVESGDGTQFTVLIIDQSQDIAYGISISITSPAVPSWLTGLLILIVIFVVIAIVGVLLRRRKKPAMAPPMAPPPYMPAPQVPQQGVPGQWPPPQQPPPPP